VVGISEESKSAATCGALQAVLENVVGPNAVFQLTQRVVGVDEEKGALLDEFLQLAGDVEVLGGSGEIEVLRESNAFGACFHRLSVT